jgi:hypothetical protein
VNDFIFYFFGVMSKSASTIVRGWKVNQTHPMTFVVPFAVTLFCLGAGAAGGLEPTSFFVASGVTVSPSDFRRESAVPRLASTLFFVDEGAVSRDEPEPIKN